MTVCVFVKWWMNYMEEATIAILNSYHAECISLWMSVLVYICCFSVFTIHLTWCMLPGGLQCWDGVQDESWSSVQTSRPVFHWNGLWLEEGISTMTISKPCQNSNKSTRLPLSSGLWNWLFDLGYFFYHNVNSLFNLSITFFFFSHVALKSSQVSNK